MFFSLMSKIYFCKIWMRCNCEESLPCVNFPHVKVYRKFLVLLTNALLCGQSKAVLLTLHKLNLQPFFAIISSSKELDRW